MFIIIIIIDKNGCAESAICNFVDTMITVASMSCVMGDFYAHMRTLRNWLESKGIDKSTASNAIGAYFQTFSHASSKPGADFDELIAEQVLGPLLE